jgi:hypothetical protein
MWGDLASTPEPCGGFFGDHPGALIGNCLYWWLHGFDIDILEFNLDSQSLTVIKRLPIAGHKVHRTNMRIIRPEDGDVGIITSTCLNLHIWDCKLSCHGAAKWVLRRTVSLQDVIGLPSLINSPMAAIVAYAEEADEIFISVRGTTDPYRDALIVV